MTNSIPTGVTPGSILRARSRVNGRNHRLAITDVRDGELATRTHGVVTTDTHEQFEVVALAYYGRPTTPGAYNLYTPVAEGQDLVARLTLSSDGIWQIERGLRTPNYSAMSSGEADAYQREAVFAHRVWDIVRESRDSDDLLVALDILLSDGCFLRKTLADPQLLGLDSVTQTLELEAA